jgi:hypothetical protein
MSEEGESVNENINLSGEEEAPEVSEYEGNIRLPVTKEEEEGIEKQQQQNH